MHVNILSHQVILLQISAYSLRLHHRKNNHFSFSHTSLVLWVLKMYRWYRMQIHFWLSDCNFLFKSWLSHLLRHNLCQKAPFSCSSETDKVTTSSTRSLSSFLGTTPPFFHCWSTITNFPQPTTAGFTSCASSLSCYIRQKFHLIWYCSMALVKRSVYVLI